MSARTTRSGSRTARRPSKSPPRNAARKASTTSRCRTRSGSGAAAAPPRTRRRARLASCRAASAERPTIGAISSNGIANMSWSTKARRSAGVNRSRTTSSASPTESASSASCSGLLSRVPVATGSGASGVNGSSRRDVRDRSMSRHTRATTVVSHPPRLSMPVVPARLSRSHAS